MATATEIQAFIKDFQHKLSFWGLLIRTDRQTNFDTLKALEYSISDVKRELAGLGLVHYSEGPLPDTLYRNADMWVFGKQIQGREVYIKITMGQPGDKVLCISFHFSQRALNYPYKP